MIRDYCFFELVFYYASFVMVKKPYHFYI